VYCTAIRVGGQDEWDFAWQRYRKTNVGSERDILLGALGCSRETWILSRYYCAVINIHYSNMHGENKIKFLSYFNDSHTRNMKFYFIV
jgi:hypothetical protein